MPPKKGKKRSFKKKADAFEKKEWFRLKVPKFFGMQQDTYGWTVANKTAQGVTVESRLEGRVANIRFGDLIEKPTVSNDNKNSINVKLRICDVKQQECLLDFHGMQITRDKKCSLMKRWVSTVDARTDVRTNEGYVFRVFCMALTKKTQFQISRAAYAKTSQIKQLRNKMAEFMQQKLSGKTLKEFVDTLLSDNSDQMAKTLSSIFPVETESCCIRKVKLMKSPRANQKARIAELYTVDTEAGLGAATD